MLRPMPVVQIGALPDARVVLDIKRYKWPAANDYWDGNWLAVEVVITMGAWRGRFEASLRADDFERSHAELEELREDLSSAAQFSSLEPWLALRLKGDGLGHILIDGEATDVLGKGARLSFQMEIDQTFLPALIAELRAVLEQFPVRGERPKPR
jgi:hypothetical protein